MLNAYTCEHGRLVPVELTAPGEVARVPVWIDLLNPTADEDSVVERRLGLDIPTRDEMQEIELSSRLYQEDGAEFLTVTVLMNLDGEQVQKTPVTFILKGQSLVTVRYADPRPVAAFLLRAQRPPAISCQTGELVMLGLIEALIDRMADRLERSVDVIDAISTEVFRSPASSSTRKTRNLQSVIERIGREGDLLTLIRESLVGFSRLASFHTALEGRGNRAATREGRTRLKIIQRDASALSEHAAFLSNKVNFLLDATLGLINLEQNQIIKIFSVAAVVFLPPTLVASIYGMNFDFMPELHWPFGYPFALGLMVASAILPYLYFKRRGWL